jgi:hypothetical protein
VAGVAAVSAMTAVFLVRGVVFMAGGPAVFVMLVSLMPIVLLMCLIVVLVSCWGFGRLSLMVWVGIFGHD